MYFRKTMAMKKDLSGADEPRVSVIVTNYNYACYVCDSIQSVLDQTYGNIEIIVVDDGSTDGSPEHISGFGKRITPLYRDHQGQCAAFNAGFAASTGEIIVFLDADDRLISDAVERFVAAFLDDKHITKSQGYMTAVDTSGRRLDRNIPHYLSPSGNYKNSLLEKGPWACAQAWTSGNAWARWFIEQVLPLPEDADNRVFPDGCLNPLAALYGPIATLDEPVACYRIHDRNNGPIGTEFTLPSLSLRLTRMRNSFEFVSERATRIGISLPLEHWLQWKTSWKGNVTVYAISLMDPSQPPPRFHEVVMAPFRTGKSNVLKATGLSFALTAVWLMPEKYALWAIRRLLRVPQARKPGGDNGSDVREYLR